MTRQVAVCFLTMTILAGSAAGAIEVAILNPTPSSPAVGRVKIVAQVAPEADAAGVDFYLDGRHIGTTPEPPFMWIVELTADPGERIFEVVATGKDGTTSRARVETPGMTIDQELDIELVQLYLTATRGDSPVLDLERGDFTVLDDSAPQEIVTFERGEVPITAVFLIDASDSMSGERLATALSSTRAFIEGMKPLDQAKLIAFSDRVVRSTPFTGFRQLILAGTVGVQGRGGTALNDHVYLALRLLEAEQGRRVVMVLSDGQDIASALDMVQVREAARGTNTLLYWLRLSSGVQGRSFSTAWRDDRQNEAEVEQLEKVIAESGGRIVDVRNIEESGSAFAEILAELRNQYVIGYYPSERLRDGSWREVAVRVKEPGVGVRTREGYFDR